MTVIHEVQNAIKSAINVTVIPSIQCAVSTAHNSFNGTMTVVYSINRMYRAVDCQDCGLLFNSKKQHSEVLNHCENHSIQKNSSTLFDILNP